MPREAGIRNSYVASPLKHSIRPELFTWFIAENTDATCTTWELLVVIYETPSGLVPTFRNPYFVSRIKTTTKNSCRRMLTEVFIASTGVPAGNSPKSSAANKNLGIYLHELQPLPRVKSTFKKSNTRSNGIAVSASHIFAAQAEGAVVHVYDRERGGLEAVIPFSEAIECLVYAGNYDGAGVIALGTARGRLMLWEAGISIPISRNVC
jgi:hypothetical protein